MRILHTSDWHIGRTFHGVDLLADQASALASIADLVASEHVDVVVVPGDIYDRAVPSADAVLVCNRGFEAIKAAGAVIVATSGNHDSPARVGAGASFAAAGGLYLLTDVGAVDKPVVLQDRFGPVVFYGIPYLEPETTRAQLGVPAARSHTAVLDAAMDAIRKDLELRMATEPSTRSVVLAHAFIVGGEATGSERSIAVGGVETAPASSFDGVDYVALGHLHSPQILTDRVRYSGSPLPYSFGERSHRKAVWILDIDQTGVGEIRRTDLPAVRGLSQLTGTVADLLVDPAHADAEKHYVSAVLTDSIRPIDALRALRTRFPHTVHVEWQRPDLQAALVYRERVHGRSDIDIAANFMSDVRSSATASETLLLGSALAFAGRELDGPPTAETLRETA